MHCSFLNDREEDMNGTILVIGATGTVGALLVKELEVKGESVRAATREPAAYEHRSHARTKYVRFDLERPETFPAALEGVERVFLIARPGDDDADRVAAPLIERMKRQGVQHVVNLSAMGTEMQPESALSKVERRVEDSGFSFTHLRPNWFMQIFSGGPLLAQILSTGAIHVPAAGAKISFVDARDVAAVAAVALRGEEHAGKAYTLTGALALDHDEVARIISEASGKTVRYLPVSEETTRRSLRAAGFPGARIERLIGFYRLVREGFCEPVSGDIALVLERTPTSFATFAEDSAASWKASSPSG